MLFEANQVPSRRPLFSPINIVPSGTQLGVSLEYNVGVSILVNGNSGGNPAGGNGFVSPSQGIPVRILRPFQGGVKDDVGVALIIDRQSDGRSLTFQWVQALSKNTLDIPLAARPCSQIGARASAVPKVGDHGRALPVYGKTLGTSIRQGNRINGGRHPLIRGRKYGGGPYQ
jgi:hypothetical protein